MYGICREYGITIIEDDAYYYLQYPSLQGSPSHLILCLTGHQCRIAKVDLSLTNLLPGICQMTPFACVHYDGIHVCAKHSFIMDY